MAITHIVTVQFKSTVAQETKDEIRTAILALKDECISPKTQRPYMKSSIGGINNSPEGLSHGLTHVFVMEFESEEDRKHYLWSDPAHLGFVEKLRPLAENVTIVDFTPGVY